MLLSDAPVKAAVRRFHWPMPPYFPYLLILHVL